MIGWEIVEIVIIDRNEQAVVPSAVVQQVLFSVLGLVIVGLTIFLWMTEYRSQHVQGEHISHA